MSGQQLTDDRLHLIARALADPRRLDLLRAISRAGDRLACECLRNNCEVTPATLSHHMKELETAGLVEATREGKFVSYRIRRDVLDEYLASMARI